MKNYTTEEVNGLLDGLIEYSEVISLNTGMARTINLESLEQFKKDKGLIPTELNDLEQKYKELGEEIKRLKK